MKLNTLLLMTHGVVAGISGGLVALGTVFGFGWAWIGVALVTAAAVLVAGWFPAWRVRRGLKTLDRALAKRAGVQANSSGILEFDRSVTRLCEYAQRWDEVSASGREQSREVESLLQVLDRRSIGKAAAIGGSPGFQLRQFLAGIGGALHAGLTQVVQCVEEIGRCSNDIASGAETQGGLVGKASVSVDHITANINTVGSKAEASHTAFSNSHKLVDDTTKEVKELIRTMERIRANAESSEKKLRALGDHSHEVSAIVDTIGEIASRTDMLALNASIESVRAGEHGKGFAVVAEEVRSLAEQATHATREVAALVETIRLETQESINGITQERARVENEVARASSAGEALGKIGLLTEESVARMQEILGATQQQHRLVEDVLATIDAMSSVNKMSRKRSERACWVVNAMSKSTRSIGAALSPLRRCSDGYVDTLEGDSTDAFSLAIDRDTLTGESSSDGARTHLDGNPDAAAEELQRLSRGNSADPASEGSTRIASPSEDNLVDVS